MRHSPLREEIAKGTDIIVLRELIGGVCESFLLVLLLFVLVKGSQVYLFWIFERGAMGPCKSVSLKYEGMIDGA